MILWTPLPAEQVLDGLEENSYLNYEQSEVEGVPVLLEKIGDGQKRVVRINSSNPEHYLNQNVYPGLIT
ncbi:YlzJ-like family protein [Desulforamulus aquiferis]|uniref:YlzJ-like family protein n=1 Tax=Desulforamulus aquiferis TaxID=1397668 RepID=A0AAW7ZE91_9FIRM|nr:YlzJ-like family protein [Desulforamulus aquiferis]MDO7787469.1 YlzJ-like family protein [Desulforamulus aquiferis]RYD06780.1 hypothetical protein N752_02270 [Desulforamulus aquiferis]